MPDDSKDMMEDVVTAMRYLVGLAEDCGFEDRFLFAIKRLWINEVDLIPEYQDQAGLFAFIATQYEVRKVSVREIEAQAYRELRLGLQEQNEKVTEARLAALVGENEFVVQVKRQVAFLGALTEAFKHKLQMLIGMGADLREEFRSTQVAVPREDRSAALDDLEKRALQVVKGKVDKPKKPLKRPKLKK